MARVKRDDQVQVIAGKDRGKRGKVRRIIPAEGRVVVEGINVVKKAMRRTEANPQGGLLTRELPLPLDRVMPVCPRCNRGVRIGFKLAADGSKGRVCRRCGEDF